MSKEKNYKRPFTCGVVLEKSDYIQLKKHAQKQQPSTTVSAIVRMLISNYLKSISK